MTVPIIVVFTKFDLFIKGLNKGMNGLGDGTPESAERYFKENYGPLFETSTKKIAGEVPYTVAASTFYSYSRVASPTLTLPCASFSACDFAAACRNDRSKHTCRHAESIKRPSRW